MGQVLRAMIALAGGVVIALVLAWASFVAWFSAFGLGGLGWDDAAGTWVLIARVVVVVVHLLWILAWCQWRWMGWWRFVAAGLSIPSLIFITYAAARLAWWMAADSTKGWSWGAGPLDLGGPMGDPGFASLLGVVIVVALGVLLGSRRHG